MRVWNHTESLIVCSHCHILFDFETFKINKQTNKKDSSKKTINLSFFCKIARSMLMIKPDIPAFINWGIHDVSSKRSQYSIYTVFFQTYGFLDIFNISLHICIDVILHFWCPCTVYRIYSVTVNSWRRFSKAFSKNPMNLPVLSEPQYFEPWLYLLLETLSYCILGTVINIQ